MVPHPAAIRASDHAPIARVLELRRYEDSDAATVWRLHGEGMRQADAHAGDGPWDDDLRSIRATYLDGGGEFLVGVLGGEVVAMGGLRRALDRTGFEVVLYEKRLEPPR